MGKEGIVREDEATPQTHRATVVSHKNTSEGVRIVRDSQTIVLSHILSHSLTAL